MKETNSEWEVSTETSAHIAIRTWLSILYCKTNIINTGSAFFFQKQYCGFYNLCGTVVATNMWYYELISKNFQLCQYKFECNIPQELIMKKYVWMNRMSLLSPWRDLSFFTFKVDELGTPCLIASKVLDRTNYSSYLCWKWFPACLVARRIEWR
jgi:hypothetical protein